MFKQKKNKKSAGFTLIELLVFAAVLAITSVTVIVSYRETARKNNLYNEAMRFVSFLRQAQNNTINGIECNDPDPAIPNCEVNEPPTNGYGIITDGFDRTKINLYANLDGYEYDSYDDPIIEVMYLQNDVGIHIQHMPKAFAFIRPFGDPIVDADGNFVQNEGWYTLVIGTNDDDPNSWIDIRINGRTGRIYVSNSIGPGS